MFRLFKFGYADMVQLFIQNRIIWIQKSVCTRVQGRCGAGCLESHNICVVKRILILEKNKRFTKDS